MGSDSDRPAIAVNVTKPELIRGAINLRPEHRGNVVTIGAYDGLHLGHQAILRQVLAKAAQLNLPSAVVVFEPLPREYFQSNCSVPRLQPFREKLQTLFNLGIHRVLCLRFNAELSQIEPRDFVRRFLVAGLGARALIIGDDFRFGHNRDGDYQLLADEARIHGFDIEAAQTVEVAGERVSSTRIRAALAVGDFAAAEALSGRPFRMSGKVGYGQQLGRTIDAPTINIPLRRRCSPVSGIFAVWAHLESGKRYAGVANLGVKPTIADDLQAVLEVHLLDFNGDLYGQRVQVEFIEKLRSEEKFDSISALRKQIQNDIAAARAVFARLN